MAKRKKDLVTLTFKGSRFDDHGLDLDSLSELISYKRILVETAMDLWLQKHPKAKNVPKDFLDSLCIKFYKIEESSTTIPLVRELEYNENDLIKEQLDDEFDEAALLIAQVTKAVSEDATLPEKFSKHILKEFRNFGRTLKDDEVIEQKLPYWRESVSYSTTTRNILTKWCDESYQDIVEKIGEVRSVNLDKHIFGLSLPDGSKISAYYTEDQEPTILNALSEHATKRLMIKGQIEHKITEGIPKNNITIEELRLFESEEERESLFDRPIWEVVSEIGESVPKADWEKVPKDLSKNIDHYLYGVPKSEE